MADEKNILIIDDEKRMAESLRELLAGFEYNVDVAYSGKEGIKKLGSNDFQLVITDIKMSDCNGFDVMEYINTHTPKTLAIVITGHASTESAIEALHKKAFDYITKPFDFELLKASVEKAFLKIEADNLRDEMIYMITHDIKIPLTSIIGFSGLVFNKQTGEMNPKGKEYVNSIYLNSQKLLTLIDNFLTTCKINMGHLTFFPSDVHINPVVRDLLTIVELAAAKAKINLKVELDPSLPAICGDENQLFRAFGNIVNNAVKYTPAGGEIFICTELVQSEDSPVHKKSVVLKVSNTGPGIPREELEGIFDRYQRSENIRGIEGSGLGLYVLKNIIKIHGGAVTVDSIPHETTAFSVYLPAIEELET
jgi:signal transduction histidine kinase